MILKFIALWLALALVLAVPVGRFLSLATKEEADADAST